MHWMNKDTPRGFLWGSKTNLECYDDGKLINRGSIELRLQHYSENSFQDHTFYVVETRMHKDIIVGMPGSSRLGLVHILCKNYSKSVSAIENKPKSSSSGSRPQKVQGHRLNIYGKSLGKKGRHQSESFQDPSQSSFKTMAKDTCTETPFKTPAKDTGNKPSFKTMHQNGQKWPKLASFKTIPSKNEDMTGSFKTPDNGSQKLASFKIIGERVKKLNPTYMVPCDEVSQVISGPQRWVKSFQDPRWQWQRENNPRVTKQPEDQDSTPSTWSQAQ